MLVQVDSGNYLGMVSMRDVVSVHASLHVCNPNEVFIKNRAFLEEHSVVN